MREGKITVREISDASGVGIDAVRKAVQRGVLEVDNLRAVSVYVVVARLRNGREEN